MCQSKSLIYPTVVWSDTEVSGDYAVVCNLVVFTSPFTCVRTDFQKMGEISGEVKLEAEVERASSLM